MPAEEATTAAGFLRKYVHVVSSSSLEDHWAVLLQGIQAMVSEDPCESVDVAVEQLEQLSPTNSTALGRAQSLLQALLRALHSKSGPANHSSGKSTAQDKFTGKNQQWR